MTQLQSEDGTPHMTFYDKDSSTSFVWDGKSPYIQVSHGGYGEPVIDEFEVPDPLHERLLAMSLLGWFELACQGWLQGREIDEGQ